MAHHRPQTLIIITTAINLACWLPTPAVAAQPSGPCWGCQFGGGSQNDYSGMALTETEFGRIDEKSGTDHRSSPGAGEHWVYAAEPACRGNTPGNDGAMCGTAALFCQQQKGNDAVLEMITRKRTSDPGWTQLAVVCVGHSDVVDPAQLQRDIDIEVTRLLRLAPPTISSAPPVRFLTNLPSDFWAAGPADSQTTPKTVSVAIDDVAVTLTATARWSWDFGDGTAPATSRTAGVPYDPGYDPRVSPAYYTADGVLHTYRAAGVYRPRVTVTWSPSYRLTYQFGSWDHRPVVYTAAKPVTVHDAHAVLTAGD